MKKRLLILSLICILMAFLVIGCSETPDGGPGDDDANTPTGAPTITATTPTVDVRDRDAVSYDYTTLFSIIENEQEVLVKPEFLDISGVSDTPGTYEVTCTYGGVTATATVNVYASVYRLTLAESSVSVKKQEALNYDYKALFTLTDDADTVVAITDAMVTTDLVGEVGNYTYRVSCGDVSKTLSIRVIPDHQVEIMTSYRNPTLAQSEVVGYDMTNLFSLYVDGIPVQVTSAMIDATAIPTDAANVKIGDTYTVTLTYTTTDGLTTHTKSTTITVVDPVETVLVGRETNVYLNASPLDLTTLFSITHGSATVPVTADMLSGSVDYTQKGAYVITLTYEGRTATATVNVIDGVVLGFAKSDTIQLKTGVNPLAYPFTEDVTVVINGERFYDIPLDYFDYSSVDFTTPGTYTVTLTVPYNEQSASGWGGAPTPIEYTLDLTYVVVDNDYTITVLEENIVLAKGTTAYNPFNNLYVTINGRGQKLTDNPAWVSTIACYARLLSDPIDFTAVGQQTMRIAVYVNGPDAPYVEVSYILRVESGIVISIGNTAVFSGSAFYVSDLFTIREGNRDIEVTSDMISGKVDVFTPGTYRVSIDYRGMTATADVVVLDRLLIGSYTTPLMTVPTYETDDSDEEVLIPGRAILDLTIGEDGSVSFASFKNGRIISALDANTLIISNNSSEYTLHYYDGIIVLDPENSLGMVFSDWRRPLVYFRSDMYNITKTVTVGYSEKYVLSSDGAYTGCYSIDTFHVEPKDGGDAFWYGLYVKLIEKMSSDTYYTVKWGEASYPADFSPRNGASSTLTFDGQEYPFTMFNGSNGKVTRSTNTNPWVGKSFTGTLDGASAELQINQYGHFALRVNGKTAFQINTSSSSSSMAEINEAESCVLLYAINNDDGYGEYSYLFDLDTTNYTFTIRERDAYYGKYVLWDENVYLFFNGYGSGRAHLTADSYATTAFTYTVNNSLVTVRYQGITPSFEYGEYAEFYLSPLLNKLTVRTFPGANVVGQDFVNTIITQGALITLGTATLPTQTSNSVGRDALLAQITITTKDGVLSQAELKECVKTSAVTFTKDGFYLYTITLDVNGQSVTTKHTVQILPKTFEGNPLAVNWHSGMLGVTALSIDEWGRVTMNVSGTIYTGLAEITENGFYANVYHADRRGIALTGTLVADGILAVTGIGDTNFNDAYTTGVVQTTGCVGAVLRKITVGEQVSYYFSTSANMLGDAATVAAVDGKEMTAVGAILAITTANGDTYVKVKAWNNRADGFIPADAHRGIYTLAGGDTLTVDGFGLVTLGSASGTYRITSNAVITVNFSVDDVRLYRLNATDGTYTVVVTATGEGLVTGATYTATYTFGCEDSYTTYTAETRFVFGPDGVVTAYSVSPSHDTGTEEDDPCSYDVYAPAYASAAGVAGTYSVTGDHVTITVGGETFVFHIPNLLTADELVCESTTVVSGVHGYFPTGTAFGRNA